MNRAFLIFYKLENSSSQRLFRELERAEIEVYGVVSASGTNKFVPTNKFMPTNKFVPTKEFVPMLRLSVSGRSAKRFEELLAELGIPYERTGEGAFCRLPRIVKKRAGLLVGAAVCAAAILAARSFVINIEVLTDSEEIRAGVMNVLAENGVGTGSYIPDIKYAELERSLKQRVEGISWAGISKTDSTLIIDVINNIPRPEQRRERLPSDIVAKHSGTVEKIELYDGLLKLAPGSGAVRGEVIISGRIPQTKTVLRDGKPVTEYGEKYVRSIGRAYGTYSDVQTFEQPYSETSLVMNGCRDDRSYLRLFDAELPLFIGDGGGLYRESASYSPLVIFGRELPVGLKKVGREGFSFRTVNYTREQAKRRAERLMDNYERGFLSGERILSRETAVDYGAERVVLTVKYEIYGVMGEERQFFVKKGKTDI